MVPSHPNHMFPSKILQISTPKYPDTLLYKEFCLKTPCKWPNRSFPRHREDVVNVREGSMLR